MVSWVKKKIEKSSYKYLLAWGGSIFVLIVAIIFFVYTFTNTRLDLRERAAETAEFRVGLVVTQMDDHLGTFEKYYISATENDDVVWLVRNNFDYSDYSKYKAAMDVLNGGKMLVDYVEGYTFVDFNTKWILSNKGMIKLDELTNAETLRALFDKSAELGNKRFWSYKYSETLSKKESVDKNFRLTFDDSNLNLVMRIPQNSLNAHALAVLKLNMTEWQRWIDGLLEDSEFIVVLSQNNEVVYSTNESLIQEAIKITSGNEKTNNHIRIKESGNFAASMAESAVTGWKYIVFNDINSLNSVSNFVPWIGMAVLVIIIGVLFGIVARLFYNPVDVLIKNISDSEKEAPSGNEFDYISHHLSGLKYDKEQLELMVDAQGTRIQEMFELRLINESIKSEDDWNDYFQGLHLPDYSFYATAVMVLDLSNEQEIQSSLSEDAICLKIVDTMPEDMKNLLWMPPVYNSCTIFCLFGADNENDLLTKICDFHEKIQKFTYDETGYRVIMGVSNTCTEHRSIRRAYRESISALTNMQNHEIYTESTKKEVPECRFFISTESDRGEPYSNSFENDIQTAIKAADKEKAYDVTNRFARHLNTVTSNDVAILYIMRYVNSILLTALDSGITLNEIAPEGINNAYRELISAIEPARVRRYIKASFIDPILAAVSERMKDDSYNIIGAIEKLVEESKGDILLAECADKLGVHQTHIWKILKMEKGLSFTEYTEKYKIEEAKKLLLQTNMTVQEIAASLNYSNAQNFIRFFSKVTGVTPGKFRKLY